MDFSLLVPWICQSLNGSTPEDILFWTEGELYAYAEETLHAAGRKYLLCVQIEDAIALVAGQAMYPVPDGHIATIYAAANGEALQTSTAAEMDALDDGWEDAAPGAITRWIGNALGLGFVRVYLPPSGAGTLTVIFHAQTPALSAAAAMIDMPAAIGDYLAVKTLEKARMRQSDGQILDAAQAFSMLGTIYEKAMEAYWGEGA